MRPIPGVLTAITLATALLVPVEAAPATAARKAPDGVRVSIANRVPEQPVTVSTDPAVPVTLEVDVYGISAAHGVTVAAEAEGLVVTPASHALGDLGEGDGEAALFEVVAQSSGLHSLTFTVTSDDQPTETVTLPHVWAAGGPPIPGGGDLSPRTFADQRNVRTPDGPVRRVSTLAFLNGRVAYIGFPPRGRPHCRGVAGRWERTRGCVPYRFDRSTGLVQVGGLIGRWAHGWLYIEGLVPHDPLIHDVYSTTNRRPNVRFARTGERFAGFWRHRDPKSRPGLDRVRLTLRRDRTYLLRYRYEGRPAVRHAGRYRVPAPGRLVLKDAHTLLVERGRRQPALWLGLPAPGGGRDAVHLVPRRR